MINRRSPDDRRPPQLSKKMPPLELHLSLPLLTIFALLALSASSDFTFPSFTSLSLRNFTFLGDSYLRNGLIVLTRVAFVPSSSSGSAIFAAPLSFFDPDSNTTASFSTHFTFSIKSPSSNSYGDGLTFFLSPDSQTLGSPGGFLGLVNSSCLTKNRFVAIEFDTRQDPHFHDPDNDHVGLDIDSLESIKTADPSLSGIDLKSGNSITAWIDYKNDQRCLLVFLSYTDQKPRKPLLSINIDLSPYLKEPVHPGFSASMERSTELHLIESWSFEAFGFLPVRPKTQPHNVSDSSVIGRPSILVSGSRSKHHKRLVLGLGITGPAFFCAVLVALGYVALRKRRKIKNVNSFKAEIMTGPREFSYKELKNATRGFHSSRILGHGAFGTVYKAYFARSGSVAAVKRSKHSHEGKTEFMAELTIIACLRHKNLIHLQGWCIEKDELLLVYDYMPNGSLDKVLYSELPDEWTLLNWTRRKNIAVGLASVLRYLHQECEQQVIHRDIKTSNVMLDGDFNPRLGDFGLARLMDHDKSPVSTLTAGTMGYLAPEYLQYGKVTEKTDVFSYGIVILEVACGRRPIERDPSNQKMVVHLVDWVWGLHSKGNIIETADKRLNGEFEVEEMRRLLLVGLCCANPDSSMRPSMRRVLHILVNEADLPVIPRVKPGVNFSDSLPLALEDLVSKCEEGEEDEDEDEDEEELRSPCGVLCKIRVD
ncbi:hypothetical protein SAY87_010396 [Trapa incisa]|uniref:non-specific serine/threonine protein kinase n=1 Tax=Trapa incisa TaxID=236973 RepID=A0AAN7JHK7_9MYRT|nr:hypothetical protein SAY87_010396 [Trapa incisa]